MSTFSIPIAQSSLAKNTFSEIETCEALRNLFHNTDCFKLSLEASSVQYTAVPQQSAEAVTSNPQKACLTIASQSLTLRTLSSMLSELVGNDQTVRIQENRFAKHFSVIAIDVYADLQIEKAVIQRISTRYKTDIYIKGSASFDTPGLVVMDMDSTIIAMECIDEIAELAGVKAQVSEVTERAMQGEIPFTQSLHDRVECLKGISLEDLLIIRNRLPFMPQFIETMRLLKRANWTLAVASGGFTFFADYVKHIAKLDYASSNVLEVKDNVLTGKVLGEVVDGAAKARVLLDLMEQYGIGRAQTVAMGDGANDLLMMEQAGTSIAYHAKPSVCARADVSIQFGGFEGLLFAMC